MLIVRLRQLGKSPLFNKNDEEDGEYFDLNAIKHIKDENDLENEFEVTVRNIKHNRNNYADEKYIEEYMQEKVDLQFQNQFTRTNMSEEALQDLILRTYAIKNDPKLYELQNHYQMMNRKFLETQLENWRNGQPK